VFNRANYVLGWVKLNTGGTSGTVVDVKIVFNIALMTNASSIILCHNHPSLSENPGDHDIKLTQNIFQVGKLINIQLLDHLIISGNIGYYSFADEGNLF
jgi:DNA repair protein RadC